LDELETDSLRSIEDRYIQSQHHLAAFQASLEKLKSVGGVVPGFDGLEELLEDPTKAGIIPAFKGLLEKPQLRDCASRFSPQEVSYQLDVPVGINTLQPFVTVWPNYHLFVQHLFPIWRCLTAVRSRGLWYLMMHEIWSK
jgi:hypothetical protein